MQQTISFVLDDKIQTLLFDEVFGPTTTVLNFLRKSAEHKGVKEGCAEGDCGACTVVIGELNSDNKITYKAMDSCLVFLPMIHGKQLVTVENLKHKKGNQEILHPVQQEMVDCNGSQCGYCTPGIIMSMFSLYKNENKPTQESIDDALTGNLCRCTGYKSIVEAAAKACVYDGKDHFDENEKQIIDLLHQIKSESKSIEIDKKQKYFQPKTKAEAFELREKMQNSVLLSGATDVALRVTKRHEVLGEIIDLSNIEELKKCIITDYVIKFGAGMSLEEVKKISKSELPALYETLAVFGSRQIRTLATFGGNLGSGSPIGDTLPTLMAYDTELKLQSKDGDRIVKMNKFLLGYRQTERKPNEIITSVIINKPSVNTQVKFYKVSKRKDLDISTVSAGFSVTLEKNKVTAITLAFGGMAAITKCATEAEVFLMGSD
ncbi:MAG: xanthine dehydrogenase small subunit [Bacteroidetes bacterium]|nr:xanthine dehydrogenase small subunit [Bacteroidota bacterium]